MSWFTLYFFTGLAVTFVGLCQLFFSQQGTRGLRTLPSLILGALLWPLAAAAYWYSRQQEVWRAGPQSPRHWLKEKETGGRYDLTDRIYLVVKHPPRKKTFWRGHLVLVRPRFTLEVPLLIAPDRIIVTTLLSQYHIYRKKAPDAK